MPGAEQQCSIIFDLVYYGGFSYESVLKMPVFERDYYHRRTIKANEERQKFEANLHKAKLI